MREYEPHVFVLRQGERYKNSCDTCSRVPEFHWHTEPVDQEMQSLSLRPGRPGPYDMETASGRYVNVKDPDPADIVLEDIAAHLSQICRYTGAVRHTYSVAEHAVLVCRRLRYLKAPLNVQLAGLHHDDAEAYLGDVGRPLKQLLGPYYALSDQMDVVVRAALGLTALPFDDPRVKETDTWALAIESQQLLPSQGKRWISDGLYRDGDKPWWPLGWGAEHARFAWMAEHENLLTEGALK